MIKTLTVGDVRKFIEGLSDDIQLQFDDREDDIYDLTIMELIQFEVLEADNTYTLEDFIVFKV